MEDVKPDPNAPKAVEDVTPRKAMLTCQHCRGVYQEDEAHVCPPEAHLWDQSIQGCPICYATEEGARPCPVNQPKAFMRETGMSQKTFDDYMAAWHRDAKDPDGDRPKAKIKVLWAIRRGFATIFCSCGMKAQVGPFSVNNPRKLGDMVQKTVEEHMRTCAAIGKARTPEIKTDGGLN